jgi:ribosomal protein S18 acetylase RimI-like enzyme
MIDGKAVIAITSDKLVVGFCYIESWGVDKNYVANSGLIVAPEFRGLGLAKK